MFDVRAHLDELRCRPTPWLHARREELVREQRRLHVEELAVTAVLDERDALGDDTAAKDGVSEKTARQTRETARRLESVPKIADAAHAGELSSEQLTPLTDLADEASDAEWAQRGPNCSPEDLHRLVRSQRKPTAADGAARRAARNLGWKWRDDTGMLSIWGDLPDLDGALFESVLNQMIDRMRPPKGQPWDSRAHRGADALVDLCRNYADVESVACPRPHLVVQVPPDGPATLGGTGIPLPDDMVEKLRATATIEPVLVDHDGVPVANGRARSALSPRIARSVLTRDGHCRWPGCDRRTGLQIHHLVPRSWGGTDDQANLAAVCAGGGTDHHAKLAPDGPYLLLGNPNQVDGLRLIRRDQLHELAEFVGTADARAGPGP